MRRREFIALVGGAATGWPLGARGQQPAIPHRVAFVALASPVSDLPLQPAVRAFVQGLQALGYVDGKNLVLEWRSAEGRLERLPKIIEELISSSKIDLIVSATTPVTKVAKNLTRTVPIVMLGNGIPVEAGLVQSLARPGGNVTGLTVDAGPDIAGKRPELLRELVPGVSQVALLRDFELPEQAMQGVMAVYRKSGIKLLVADHTPAEFAGAFALIAREHPQALTVASTAAAYVARYEIVEFAAKSQLPSMYPNRDFVLAGGPISYGVDFADLFRRGANYVDRIFKGANPGDLPVEEPTKYELVINLKTAKSLGLTIPPSLLARADEVIE